ncbi:MAG: Pycsar system effector family protein [Saprospiraceae bacterium]
MEEEKKITKQTSRGRETLFRVTYSHQSKLIQVADYKANIIISVSTMIISALVAFTGFTAAADKISLYGFQVSIPLALILLTCLISMVLAIQAARPKLINKWDPNSTAQKSSLLFFGVIANYTQEAYVSRMNELMKSGDEMYDQMIIDLHNQGIVLKRKYNLLSYAYQVLMFGFALSVIVYLSLLVSSYL